VLATFIAIGFVDKLGRKLIMYAGFITMGTAMIAVGTLFNLGIENITNLAMSPFSPYSSLLSALP
jgi:hypothetical protein